MSSREVKVRVQKYGSKRPCVGAPAEEHLRTALKLCGESVESVIQQLGEKCREENGYFKQRPMLTDMAGNILASKYEFIKL